MFHLIRLLLNFQGENNGPAAINALRQDQLDVVLTSRIEMTELLQPHTSQYMNRPPEGHRVMLCKEETLIALI
jgi:ABC-type amino acid transport substrate-binding protein